MLTNIVKLAAEKARDAAEEYFRLQNLDMAIKTLKAARDFNPYLPNLDDYFTAYRVHQLAALKSTWYEILAITDPKVDVTVIKKQYKRLALMLHPDKNTSIAAEGAFKIIQSAREVLTNPQKREDYDRRFCFKKSKAGSSSSRCHSQSQPQPQPRADGDDNFSRARKPSSFGFKKTDTPPKPKPNNSSKFKNTDPPNSSSKFKVTNPIRTSYSCSQRCSARVEISGLDGTRKIIISTNGRDEDFINFGANDSSDFHFFCSFFFGNHTQL